MLLTLDAQAFKFIGDFLYGEKPEDLSAALDDRNYYADLAKCDSAFWTGLIKVAALYIFRLQRSDSSLQSLLLDQPHVLVLGRPSTAYAAKLADDEKARIASQVRFISRNFCFFPPCFRNKGPDGLVQRQALGEAKLKELGERLEKAIEQNEQLIPIEIIGACPSPIICVTLFFSFSFFCLAFSQCSYRSISTRFYQRYGCVCY
jgi:hypothetical protein